MLRQIRLLTGIRLCNLFGINELRYTRDKGKRLRAAGLGVVWILVLFMLACYSGGYAWGLAAMGLEETSPIVLAVTVSGAVFIFSFLKAGSVIFQRKDYELQQPLPVKTAAIITSRFLTMYVTDLMLSVLVMLPGLAVYAMHVRPGVLFWIYAVVGMGFLPLLPLTVATILGAVILAVSARWKHKNLVNIGLTLLLILGTLGGSMVLSWQGGTPEGTDQLQNLLTGAAGLMKEKVGTLYPPALWFGDALLLQDVGRLLLLAGVSTAVFLVYTAVLQKHFSGICTALDADSARGGFSMKQGRKSGLLASLWRRELIRYVASPVYVTNTIVGYILMTVVSAGVLFVGPERLVELLGMSAQPGAQEMTERLLPFLLGLLAAMMPPSCSSVSMEGRQWWIMQTLPVPPGLLYGAKFLASLSVALPFWLISEVLCLAAIKPDPAGAAGLILIPALYLVGSAAAGLLINSRFPVFDWDSEVRVVKQSASVFLTMLLGMAAGIIPVLVILNRSL